MVTLYVSLAFVKTLSFHFRPNPESDPIHQDPGDRPGRSGDSGRAQLLLSAGLPRVPDARDGGLYVLRLPLPHVLSKVRGGGQTQEGVRHFRFRNYNFLKIERISRTSKTCISTD